MKTLIVLLSFGILSSCSSVMDKKSLSQRIEAEEVRSVKEIRSHADELVEIHSELDEKTKKEIQSLLNITLIKHQDLKDEESKILQLLLKLSLRVNQLTEREISDKNKLKIRLRDVYDEKSKNILFLVNKIVSLSEQNAINEGFRHDIIQFMRDFR